MTYLIFFPQYPAGHSRKVLASKKKKIGPTMVPGVRASKSVRASQGSQVQTPESQTRSSKRLQPSTRDGQNVEDPTDGHDEIPPQRSYTDAEEGNGAGGQDNTAAKEVSGAGAQDSTGADEDNVARAEDTEGKL